MTRQEILAQFATYDEAPEIIKSPGKFEGEGIWAPYFWEKGLEGELEENWTRASEEEEEQIYLSTTINEFDVREFPELIGDLGKRLDLWEDSAGFVHSYID